MPSSDVGQAEPAGGLDTATPGGQGGQRPAPHERVTAPALAALDRLEEEPVALPHDVGEAGDRRQRVGHHLAPDGHDRVLLGQRGELGRVGPESRGRAADRLIGGSRRRHARTRCRSVR